MFTRFTCNQMFPGAASAVVGENRPPNGGLLSRGQWYLWHVGCTKGRSLRAEVGPGAGHQGAAGPSGKSAGSDGSLASGRRWKVLGIYKPNRKPAEPEL
jgi:hypothetical protein